MGLNVTNNSLLSNMESNGLRCLVVWHVENRSEMSVLDRLRFFTMKTE